MSVSSPRQTTSQIKSVPPAPPERASRVRQRQRLIDACISALHIHGPSRTTVEKVVAIAQMSPGIVRFYFDSKDAMLVASLEFLAAQFEERVLLPVTQLKDQPARALELLVDLYLDPDVASPRKVSVWYSFWGEASSRQEYLDICGQKDESFAALVRELIERLIIQTRAQHLDADGVALGLIGALEVLWQGFAFQTEANIDRMAAKRRCMAYLRSVFTRQFGTGSAAPAPGIRETVTTDTVNAANEAAGRLPGWTYANAAVFAAERERLFPGTWQIAGHEAQLPRGGDFIALDLPGARALLVRGDDGAIRAFRNTCRQRPHAIVAERTGRLEGRIECAIHGLAYAYDGALRDGETLGDLVRLEVAQRDRLLLVRSTGGEPASREGDVRASAGDVRWEASRTSAPSLSLPATIPVGMQAQEITAAADWKVIVEQWLEFAVPEGAGGRLAASAARSDHSSDGKPEAGVIAWLVPARDDPNGWDAGSWTARRYASVAGDAGRTGAWQRLFVYPNQLIELWPQGLLILQVIPEAPGRCRIRHWGFSSAAADRRGLALHYLARRLSVVRLARDAGLAESTQAGLTAPGYEADAAAPVSDTLAAFRRSVVSLLPGDRL